MDIYQSDFVEQYPEIPQKKLLSILHLKTIDGQWLLGLDAMVAAWRHTPFGWLLLPLRWPVIKPLSDAIYRRWARARVCKVTFQ